MVQTRLLSSAERLWLAADRVAPGPFVIQLVVEGEGDLSLDALSAAVLRATNAHRGVSLQLAGVLGWSRWRATDQLPAVREVDGSGWDGRSPVGAPFLLQPLDPRKAACCEVLLARGQPTRVVVRAHHALMDGVAVRELVFDVFRALRGEPLLGSSAGPLTEYDIAKLLPQSAEKQPGAQFASITGAADDATGATWRRVTVNAKPGRILARTAEAVVRTAAEYSDGPWRICIPVDIRRHWPGLRSSANLTGVLRFDGTESAFDADALERRIDGMLADRLECLHSVASDRLRWFPLSLMELMFKAAFNAIRKKGLYPNSALLSNLGRQSLDSLNAPDWTPTALFWIPPSSGLLPLFLGMVGHEGGLELCGSAPAGLAGGGRLDGVLRSIASRLE